MKLTVDYIARILNIPDSTIMAAMEELGLKSDGNQLLGEKEIKKLRPLLFRFYQQSRADFFQGFPEDASVQAVAVQSASADVFLEQLILDHVIMIDTCSFMCEGCSVLVEKMSPILREHNKKVVIPYKVVEELKKHYNSRNDPHKTDLAENGLKICQKLKDLNCITIRGNKNDNFADNVFFVHFADLRFRYRMLLITQDYKLGHDVLQLNNMKTGGGNPVRVFRISPGGSLMEFEITE